MEEYQKRMLDEHSQLVERLSKLNAALEIAESRSCPVYSYD